MKLRPSLYIASLLFAISSLFSASWGQSKFQPVSSTDPVSLTVAGKVVDAATHKPIAGAEISAINQKGKVIDKKQVGNDGAYQLVLNSKEGFILSVDASGYENLNLQLAPTAAETNIIWGKLVEVHRLKPQPIHTNATAVVQQPASTPDLTTSTTTSAASSPSVALPEIKVTGNGIPGNGSNQTRVIPPKTLDAKVVYTPPLIVAPTGKTTQLRSIQFVQSKAELLPDAQPALEQLLAFMRDKPTVEIELAGHTDNQGDFDKNVLLSKQRVDVVKDYLVTNGIAANRITTRGYGPTRPIASNNSEVTRQLNRRVELTVTKQ